MSPNKMIDANWWPEFEFRFEIWTVESPVRSNSHFNRILTNLQLPVNESSVWKSTGRRIFKKAMYSHWAPFFFFLFFFPFSFWPFFLFFLFLFFSFLFFFFFFSFLFFSFFFFFYLLVLSSFIILFLLSINKPSISRWAPRPSFLWLWWIVFPR